MSGHHHFKRLPNLLLVSILAGMTGQVYADGFAIQDNKLTITGSGASAGFSEEATFGSDGVVEHIPNVPLSSEVGIPSFSFNLVNNNVAPGTYEFRVGVIFDRRDNQSRLETKIERLIITVGAGGTVTGSIPSASNDLVVLARPAGGGVTYSATLTNAANNGPVILSGSNVTFSATRLIDRISNLSSLVKDVVLEEFDDPATYDYQIIVDQQSGPATIRFTTTSDAALPTVNGSSIFVLNPGTGTLGSQFTDAYSVTGSFTVAGPGPSPSSTPSPSPAAPVVEEASPSPSPAASPSASPSPSSTPIPSPSPTPPPVNLGTALENLGSTTGTLNQILEDGIEGSDPSVLINLTSDVLSNSVNVTDNLQFQLLAGQTTVQEALTALDTAGNGFAVVSTVSSGTGDSVVNANLISQSLDGFANVINAISSSNNNAPLSQTVLTQVTTFAESKLTSTAQLIKDDTPPADVEKVMASTTALLNATLSTGAPLSQALVTSAVTVALKAVQSVLPDLASSLGLGTVDFSNPTAVTTLLQSEPAALSSAINTSPAVTSRTSADEERSTAALQSSGVNPETAARIFASLSAAVSNTDGVRVGNTSATTSLLNALARAFGVAANASLQEGLNFLSATSFAVVVDPVTGALRVNTATESYSATSTATRLVPSVVPEGVSYLADGRAVAVADGVAVELAPAAADLLSFAAAVELAGFPATFRNNGTIALALGGNQRFSGAFAYDNIAGKSGECGAVSFQNPTGAVNAANYTFKMTCANGIQQNIVPFIDNAAFYSALSSAGLTVRTDRNTGALTIGNTGRFKPSFFVTPLSTADQAFLTQNGTNGFAFRAKDANGDGRMDYEVISSTGVQLLYAMP